ncbi:MAG: protein kinase [Acidobacteriota bacterium]
MSNRRIGNYQITDYVGSGGFGSVFKAEDVNTPGRVVAIKELHKKHTRNQVIKQRFFQEAVAMARLDHPNLPRLYTFGEDNGSYYLVMEFISGKLLSDELHEDGPMRPDRAVDVLTQVLDAVSYAHRNGIIHRDLKPDNIILVGLVGLVGNGGALRIKVLDFGIARMVGGESLTLAGEGFGTPTYMAPERMSGAAGDDPRMDLYAAGIILFEMLSGKPPFESKASDPAAYWLEMRKLHQSEPLPALAPLGVSNELERVALRATAKRLEDRYQSADEMLEDLRSLSVARTDVQPAVPSSSRLLLSTAPAAAEVYVDDVLRGTSEGTRGKILVDGLTAGLHTVRVLKEGYNEYRINVALDEGRQTDLQVALSARATVEMPRGESTAAGGFGTLKLQGADDVKTALLVVESLPAGSALFIGSEQVAHAGEDGRATLRLSPGSHEIRAATPSGATATRVVSVTADDTGAMKTMTLPLTQATVSGIATSRPQSRRGKQIAAAAVVILLLALGAAAYLVLRGPDHRVQVESVSVAPAGVREPPAKEPASVAQPSAHTGEQQANENKKRAAEERRKAEQDAAAIEAQKKANEAKAQDKAEKKDASAQQPAPAVPAPQPTVPAKPPASAVPDPEPPSPSSGRDGCVLVTVTDADGQPVPGVRVGLVDSDGPSSPLGGRTGEKGRWQSCGLTPGHRIRVAVLGPRGGMLGTQTAVVAAGRNFIGIRLDRKMDEAPQFPPRRQRPFRRP